MQRTKPRWLPIDGAISILDGEITFVGEKRPTSKDSSESKSTKANPPRTPESRIRSDTYFESGSITGELRISVADLKVFFRLGVAIGTRTSVGLGVAGKTYGLVTVEKDQQRELDAAGFGTTAPLNTWFKFCIRVRGSQLEFEIEDIRVLQGTVKVLRAQLEVVFQGEGTTELRNVAVEAVRPEAFVVMQFTDEYTALYKDVIEPVCISFGYDVVRGGNVYTSGLIIEDITRSIRECSVVIADITPNNANVYYELGFAHGIGKPAILLRDSLNYRRHGG